LINENNNNARTKQHDLQQKIEDNFINHKLELNEINNEKLKYFKDYKFDINTPNPKINESDSTGTSI